MFNNFFSYNKSNEVPYEILATTPEYLIGGFDKIGEYIKASAGLNFLMLERKLDIHYMNGTINFVCRSRWHLEYVKKNFKQTLVCPPELFNKNSVKTRPIDSECPIEDEYEWGPDDV